MRTNPFRKRSTFLMRVYSERFATEQKKKKKKKEAGISTQEFP